MEPQQDSFQTQAVIAKSEPTCMGHMCMPMQGCHVTMCVFGALVILGLAVQAFLLSKMLKELRKGKKK